jgi:hypothetical protein
MPVIVSGCGGGDDDAHPPASAAASGAAGRRGGNGGESAGAGRSRGGAAGSSSARAGSAGSTGQSGSATTSESGGASGESGAGGHDSGEGGAVGAGAAGEGDAGGAGGESDCGVVPGQTKVVLVFDTTNPSVVTDFEWTGSVNGSTGNVAANGGSGSCSTPTPSEFFGQAYAAPEGNAFSPIGAEFLGTRTTCGLTETVVSAPEDCNENPLLPTTTVYQRYGGTRSNRVLVTRTFNFDSSTPVSSAVGLRPFVPRLPLAMFADVVYPNGAGTATTVSVAGPCADDCLEPTGTDWNGRWFAQSAPTGLALVVVRDASLTSTVELAINSDGNSGSNLSSFVLVQPNDGWHEPVTEIERLCFEDLSSWPQAERDAATLPSDCSD